jgi:hypothetical protein
LPAVARSLARVYLRYDSPTETEPGGGGRRIVTAPLSFDDFAIVRELPADSAAVPALRASPIDPIATLRQE